MLNQSKSIPSVASVVAEPSAAPNDKRAELELLINSRSPIITVETPEEDRLQELLLIIATRLQVPLYTWTVTTGLAMLDGAPVYQTTQPEQALANIAAIAGDAIFLLKDFARYCENDRISRLLRDLCGKFRSARRSLVIVAPSITLPPELETESVPFSLGLPAVDELLSAAREVLVELSHSQRIPVTLDALTLRHLAQNLSGLTADEAVRLLRRCILARGKADGGLLDSVLEAKRDALGADGLLEPVKAPASFDDIAGLVHLRSWLEKRRSAFTPEGQKFGLVAPKGVLITGVQGCGKSLAARAVAGDWGVELARFDAGMLYDKYIGESEKRLRRVLEMAQRLAPLVLWIDEIEKAFAGSDNGGEADAGLSRRILATFLTWMQDRDGGVFLVATSNDISVLPPEMLRKGRFDEIFFVDLPDAAARSALFALHLKKRGRDAASFDLPTLAAASDGFSGAEIEQAIAAALYTAFDRKQQLTTEILLGEIRATRPLSVTRAEEVQAIRAWAKDRAVPAD